MGFIRKDFVGGYITAVGGTGTNGFEMDSSDSGGPGTDGLSELPVVTADDECYIVLDPNQEFGNPEIVRVGAHSSSATTADIEASGRGLFGTTARSHDDGTYWCLAAIENDLGGRGVTATATGWGGTTTPDYIDWNGWSYDPDSYAGPTNDVFTIPTGRAGTYAITAHVTPDGAAPNAVIEAGGVSYPLAGPAFNLSMNNTVAGTVVVPLVEGDTVKVKVRTTTSQSVEASLALIRLCPHPDLLA